MVDSVMNGNVYKFATTVLTALVIFLAGWVWQMERRVTTLEVGRVSVIEDIKEIKDDVKEILRELRNP
jgi:hypothetical protein